MFPFPFEKNRTHDPRAGEKTYNNSHPSKKKHFPLDSLFRSEVNKRRYPYKSNNSFSFPKSHFRAVSFRTFRILPGVFAGLAPIPLSEFRLSEFSLNNVVPPSSMNEGSRCSGGGFFLCDRVGDWICSSRSRASTLRRSRSFSASKSSLLPCVSSGEGASSSWTESAFLG